MTDSDFRSKWTETCRMLDHIFQGELENLHKTIRKKEQKINPAASYKEASFESRKYENGEYPCIYLHTQHFLESLQNAKPYLKGRRNLHFVDAGCGLGAKVFLATHFFHKSTGVEISPEYVKLANGFLKRWCRDTAHYDDRTGKYVLPIVIQDDIINHDFSPYDVIYFYSPLSDAVKERAFEFHLLETAKPGALIIGHLSKLFGRACFNQEDTRGYGTPEKWVIMHGVKVITQEYPETMIIKEKEDAHIELVDQKTYDATRAAQGGATTMR